jgi:hypothetical protein
VVNPPLDAPRWTVSPVDYLRQYAGNRKPFRMIAHVREHFREQLELLCILLRPVGNLTLCVDELGLLSPPALLAPFPRR